MFRITTTACVAVLATLTGNYPATAQQVSPASADLQIVGGLDF